MAITSVLCQLNDGCMGCCGHNFSSKEEIKRAIDKNSKEFEDFNPKSEKEFIGFRDRAHSADLRYGVCRNLIRDNGCLSCPLHPAQHQGKDLRIGHCNTNYLCSTARDFEDWDENKKKSFLIFIKSKKLNNIEYSINLDNVSILREFKTLISLK